MPSAGFRPVTTSQNWSLLLTPLPSTCGQVTLADAAMRDGSTGLAAGFAAGFVAGFVVAGFFAVNSSSG